MQARYHRLAGFVRPFRRQLGLLIALTGAISLLAMLPPLLLRGVINDVVVGNDRSRLFMLGSFMLLVPFLHALAAYLQVMGVSFLGQHFVLDVRCALFGHLMRLSMRFFGRESVGKLVNRLMADSGVMQQMLTVATVQILSDFICSAFAITVTFLLNWRLAGLLVVVVILFVINYRINIARIKTATRGYRGAEDRLAGGIQNRLGGSLTVKSYGAESREHNLFHDQSRAALNLVRDSQYATSSFSMNTALLRDIGRAAIYFIGCAMVLRGDATYGDVVAFTAYAMQLLAPAVRFSSIAQQLQDVGISVDRIFELFDEQPEIAARAGAPPMPRPAGRVDFQNVVFGYTPDVRVLDGIDFHVEPGETVALVGPTGCGKSTILSLLLRFFDVQSGAILIDGVDLRDVDVRSLRRQFSIVLQESLLFDMSIADNIAYSRPGATREQIVQAARVAEIHTLIEALPDGYDARLGGRAVQLSVGEKQRISIARAVLANPAILIMDEATSSLDSESEHAIQVAMDRFLAGRTSFIVAHRLSTIRNANRIILLARGRILEMGSHDELMAAPGGRYRDLYEKHAGRGVITEE